MRIIRRGTEFLGCLLLLSGCGKSTCASPAFLYNGICYGYVNKGTLAVTAGSISGTGSVVAQVPLSGTSSAAYFRVVFTIGDGGTFTLDTHGTSALAGALQVEFKRSGSSLEVRTKGSGTTKDLSSSFASGVDPTRQMIFQIDVHNTENPAHFLIWDSGVTSYTSATARVSDHSGPAQSTGGAFWGFELQNAAVLNLESGSAKNTE